MPATSGSKREGFGVEFDDFALVHEVDEDMTLAVSNGRLGNAVDATVPATVTLDGSTAVASLLP